MSHPHDPHRTSVAISTCMMLLKINKIIKFVLWWERATRTPHINPYQSFFFLNKLYSLRHNSFACNFSKLSKP
jgi:hypothetical protein